MKAHTEIRKLSAEALAESVGEGKPLVIVDILPGDHFADVHLPSAKNACVFEVTFLDQVAGLVSGMDVRIVVYGTSERSMDAAFAARKLIEGGYTDVAVLEGGLARWRELGYPLEGKAPDAEGPLWADPFSEDGTHEVDIENSLIQWTGRNPNTRHFGTLKLSGGKITAENGRVTGSFDIDMRSIKSLSLAGDELQPVLESHLESDDFFLVHLFPVAKYTIASATRMDEPTATAPNYRVDGELSLRGVSRALGFPATVNSLPDGQFTAQAHFDLDRTRWDIIYGSNRFFERLGMHVVFDQITIELKIVTK
jgi:rhodanese-related sulfurtransferase/polyisoprenoid-binding protein YceI